MLRRFCLLLYWMGVVAAITGTAGFLLAIFIVLIDNSGDAERTADGLAGTSLLMLTLLPIAAAVRYVLLGGWDGWEMRMLRWLRLAKPATLPSATTEPPKRGLHGKGINVR